MNGRIEEDIDAHLSINPSGVLDNQVRNRDSKFTISLFFLKKQIWNFENRDKIYRYCKEKNKRGI